jgi:ribonuclease D
LRDQQGNNLLPLEIAAPSKELSGDVTEEFYAAAVSVGRVALDIETSGLDWKSERIGLCQIFIPGIGVSYVKSRKKEKPARLKLLLAEKRVQKIIHHAMFDLRFLSYHWRASVANVGCTKIASKLLRPGGNQKHSLSQLLEQHLSITLDKTKQRSDWLAWNYSADQLSYASADVIYLPALFDHLMGLLKEAGKSDLANECFAHIPTRVKLEIEGYGDVFTY